ncbi:MAG: hypothetical protein AAJB65_00045 [Candidatus Hodgkinia cicadicola]
MINFRSYKRWILDVLSRECSERVIEINLPIAVPDRALFGWKYKHWGVEIINGRRVCYLFQAVVDYYLCLRPRNSVGVYFGELFVGSRFVPYLGLTTRDLNCWASCVRGIRSAWKAAVALTSSSVRSKVVLKVCSRDVYNVYVDACGFSVFVTGALKACYGDFSALSTLLAILSNNVVDSSRKQFYAVNEGYCSRLAYLYYLMCNECGGHCDKQRIYELARLRLLTCFGFVPSHKLDMFKRLLALDLDLTSTLALFHGMPRYSKAWLYLKRLRDNLSDLDLEIKHVCWLDSDAKVESNLLFQFDSSAVSVVGESYQLEADTVTSSLIRQSE